MIKDIIGLINALKNSVIHIFRIRFKYFNIFLVELRLVSLLVMKPFRNWLQCFISTDQDRKCKQGKKIWKTSENGNYI